MPFSSSSQESFAFLFEYIKQSLQQKPSLKQWLISRVKPIFEELKQKFYLHQLIAIKEVPEDLLTDLFGFLAYCF
jgi:hypothetical protein